MLFNLEIVQLGNLWGDLNQKIEQFLFAHLSRHQTVWKFRYQLFQQFLASTAANNDWILFTHPFLGPFVGICLAGHLFLPSPLVPTQPNLVLPTNMSFSSLTHSAWTLSSHTTWTAFSTLPQCIDHSGLMATEFLLNSYADPPTVTAQRTYENSRRGLFQYS